MMPIYYTHQGPSQMVPVPALGHHHACQHHLIHTAIPPKRTAGGDDDDIQFISEKPVKKRKISERQPEAPMGQNQLMSFAAAAIPNIPNIPMAQMQLLDSELRDAERRLSTGMVGLPSDLHAMELTYALRGVSMPVLEKFVLNQPSRKPRPLSPPELSPKQLPTEIPRAEATVQPDQHRPAAVPGPSTSSNSPMVRPNQGYTATPRQAQKAVVTPNLAKTTSDSSRAHTQGPHANVKGPPKPCSPDHATRACPKSTPMPPPPSPTPNLQRPETSQNTPCPESGPKPSENHRHNHNSSAHLPKQPCQACSRLRQQAQLSRAQGIPIMNAALPPRFMPQLHCPQPYGPKLYPQGVPMPASNMHHFTPNYGQLMMPVGSNPFAALPSHSQHPPPGKQAAPQPPPAPAQQKGAEKEKPKPAEKAQLPPTSKPANTAAGAASPAKTQGSLTQPTYRKPSPNLIVDVAETCQERFPFDEVAKRHNVSVEKVLDVFAAIIQVPLLRCPTDRRRAGRLATARIKEYNKAKKAIRDSRAEGGKVEKQATAKEIAKRLGQVEVPEGFTGGE